MVTTTLGETLRIFENKQNEGFFYFTLFSGFSLVDRTERIALWMYKAMARMPVNAGNPKL